MIYAVMPRRCSVYGCRSNYDKETERTTTYALPRDENLRKLWLECIPTDFSELKSPSVCIKHFAESDIKRVDRIMLDGEMMEYQRRIPKLINNAVPTIFPTNISNGRKKCKVKCLSHGEDQQATEVQMDSNTTAVILETYDTQFIKTEIKEEVSDVNEESIEAELVLEELSKQNGVVCVRLPCENNQLFRADNQQTNVKIEIKEEPVWFENTLIETNGEFGALDLQNENEDLASLITGSVEDEELRRLDTGVGDRGFSSFTVKQELSSGLEDDNVDHFEESEETHEYEQVKKSCASVKQNKSTKPYRCDICDASFKRALSLKTHKLTHEDNKEYKCDVCEKNFKCPSTLRRHGITHDDKQPFKCKICNASFKRLPSLKRHKLTHDHNRTHKCEHCEKMFKRLLSLKRHCTIYHDRKSYRFVT